MWAIEAMQVNTGGPYIHDDPHQRGAALEAAEPLFVQEKNMLETIKSLLFNMLLFQIERLIFT